MYLLDTTHCSHLLNGDEGIARKLAELNDIPVKTCVIVKGELVCMAVRSQRKEENEQKVASFLNDIEVLPVDSKAAEEYGNIKNAVLTKYGSQMKSRRRKTTLKQIGLTDNDLWIAAIAKRHNLTVVSGDGDFSRIKEAVTISLENWKEQSES